VNLMRKSERESISPPSLFNFLSVLLCLLGALMFIAIAVTSLGLDFAVSNLKFEISWKGARNKRPIFLECVGSVAKTGDGLMFNLQSEQANIEQNQLTSSSFYNFINRIGQDEYVFFIIRPSGITVYETLLTLVKIHNKQKCSSSVSISGKPDQATREHLPRSLLHRLHYQDGQLCFEGIMLPQEREALKTMFHNAADRSAIEHLWALSQDVTAQIDYGTELIAENWHLKVKQPSLPEGGVKSH
jgi:hypothetical protein